MRWMYKEGWKFSISFLFILFYAALLIFSNLGQYDIYGDERWSVEGVESLRQGEGFKLWNFVTSSPQMAHPDGKIIDFGGYLMTSLFGYNNFNLRFIPALFGLLNISLIYFLFKKIFNKPTSIVATFGFSINITALYLARFLRPYTIFLFLYLACLLLIINLYESFKKRKSLFNKLILGLLLFLVMVLTIEERPFGKILFLLVPLCLIFLPIKLRKIKLTSFVLVLLTFTIFLISTFYFKIINVQKLSSQIITFFSLNMINYPNIEYYYYLFVQHIRIPSMFYIPFLLSIPIILYQKKNRVIRIYFMIFSLIPLIILVYLLNRYVDPRYSYFILPFIYGLSIYGLFIFLKIFKPLNFNLNKLICFLIICTLLLYVLPFGGQDIPGVTIKSPSHWDRVDGEKYWHYRGVPPEYNKVFTYLNEVQKEGDVIIMASGFNYIMPKEFVDYYFIYPYGNYREVFNLREYQLTSYESWENPSGSPIGFFELVNKSQGDIWLVVPNPQMLDKDLIDYLFQECGNVAEELGVIKYYGFSSSKFEKYKELNHYPNLFLCE